MVFLASKGNLCDISARVLHIPYEKMIDQRYLEPARFPISASSCHEWTEQAFGGPAQPGRIPRKTEISRFQCNCLLWSGAPTGAGLNSIFVHDKLNVTVVMLGQNKQRP